MCLHILQGGACELPGKSDSREFKKLSSSMEVLGIQVSKTDHSGLYQELMHSWKYYMHVLSIL